MLSDGDLLNGDLLNDEELLAAVDITELVVPLPTRRATKHLARALAKRGLAGDLFFLEGPLGVGKTFFARAFLRALGVPTAIAVQSPTFALLHEYDAKLPIVHGDLYRLDEPESVLELGLLEKLESSILLMEWSLRFVSVLGGDGLSVTLSGRNASERKATLRALGPRGQRVIEGLART